MLDIWYLRHASLWLDIGILLQTLPMVLFGERSRPEAVQRAWDELAGSAILVKGRAHGWRPHAA